MPPKTTSLVTTRQTCPLCQSTARREIDLLIAARTRKRYNGHAKSIDPDTGEILTSDNENNGDFADVTDTNFTELEPEVRELLGKLPSHKTPDFTLPDLVLHATSHPLVTDFAGSMVKTEGNLLFWDEQVYQSPDLKDFLRAVIIRSLQELQNGELKITPTFAINAVALLWRMTGDSGSNEFLTALQDKITKGTLGLDSPLGKAFVERQQKIKADVPLAPPELNEE